MISRALAVLCAAVLAHPLLLSAQEPAHPAAAPPAAAVRQEAERVQKAVQPTALGVVIQQQEICRNGPVPAGWIEVNDRWDPTVCGKPNFITYNVWILWRYDVWPVGSQLFVCSSAPTPSGWQQIETHWDPTACGRPQSTTVKNIKTIKRLR